MVYIKFSNWGFNYYSSKLFTRRNMQRCCKGVHLCSSDTKEIKWWVSRVFKEPYGHLAKVSRQSRQSPMVKLKFLPPFKDTQVIQSLLLQAEKHGIYFPLPLMFNKREGKMRWSRRQSGAHQLDCHGSKRVGALTHTRLDETSSAGLLVPEHLCGWWAFAQYFMWRSFHTGSSEAWWGVTTRWSKRIAW